MIFIGPDNNVIDFGIYMYKKDSLSQGTSKHFVQKYLFLVLLVPIIVISVRLFIQQGAVINGDFPSFEVSNHSFERLWLWVDKGSYSGFENLDHNGWSLFGKTVLERRDF